MDSSDLKFILKLVILLLAILISIELPAQNEAWGAKQFTQEQIDTAYSKAVKRYLEIHGGLAPTRRPTVTYASIEVLRRAYCPDTNCNVRAISHADSIIVCTCTDVDSLEAMTILGHEIFHFLQSYYNGPNLGSCEIVKGREVEAYGYQLELAREAHVNMGVWQAILGSANGFRSMECSA